jgi:hypothetical protein
MDAIGKDLVPGEKETQKGGKSDEERSYFISTGIILSFDLGSFFFEATLLLQFVSNFFILFGRKYLETIVTKFLGGHTRRKSTFDETLLHLADDHSKNLDSSGNHTFALPFRFRLNKLSFITCFG